MTHRKTGYRPNTDLLHKERFKNSEIKVFHFFPKILFCKKIENCKKAPFFGKMVHFFCTYVFSILNIFSKLFKTSSIGQSCGQNICG